MKYIVFYSWQSDLPNNLNRSFIESILEKATKSISKDQNFSIEPVIDRDTVGVPGSPSIISTITEKIAKADFFVCDISIVNHESVGRKTPNPNVLLELGYASAVLGWERIIMIQNIAFGGLELLPFDLRGRRIVDYYLANTLITKIETKHTFIGKLRGISKAMHSRLITAIGNKNISVNKTETKQIFENKLLGIFKTAFIHHSTIGYLTTNATVWWGDWELETRRKLNGGKLSIHRVSSTNFYFDLHIVDGARSGELNGKAKIIAPNAAVARVNTYDDKICEVIFRRKLNVNNKWTIEVEEGQECRSFHGQGAYFDGTYSLLPERVLHDGYLDEIDINEISRVTGRFCQDFMNCFQRIGEQKSLDNNITKVVQGGGKGLYTIMESIVGLNDEGDVWCAFIDADVVRYFTNVTTDIEVLPKTFEEWRSRFPDKEVLFSSKESTKVKHQ